MSGQHTRSESRQPATRRLRRNFRRRRVTFMELPPGVKAAGELLGVADAAGAELLFLVGDHLSYLGPIRRFSSPEQGELPAGWRPARQGHYLRAPAPAWRFEHESGRRLTIQRAASYFGDGRYTPTEAGHAWEALERLLAAEWDDGRLLATPATTGRYLLGRSIPFGREWPVLSDEHQELIRATSGAGRIQHLGPAGRARRGDLHELDARLAYVACARELPAGLPTHDGESVFEGYTRGRYRVRATVPADWESSCACGMPGHARIGLLAHAERDGSWSYPAEPRHTFTSWADAAEVRVAIRHGWPIRILERLLFPMPPYPLVRSQGRANKRGPLDAWAERLGRLRETCTDPLVRVALRNIALHGIGALHGRPHRTTHELHLDRAHELGADGALPVSVDRAGDYLVYELEGASAAWSEMSHPEWSSAIWARQRARLLEGPGAGRTLTGALHVPAESVVAFRTDALYLRHLPAWTDDGALGRLRPVAAWHDVTLPRTRGELDGLKHRGAD